MNRQLERLNARLDARDAAREALRVALDALRQWELVDTNAARLAAYQRKLQAWRKVHRAEYFERLRRGLDVRAKWRRMWGRRAREASAPWAAGGAS